jgi:hypothetical protein
MLERCAIELHNERQQRHQLASGLRTWLGTSLINLVKPSAQPLEEFLPFGGYVLGRTLGTQIRASAYTGTQLAILVPSADEEDRDWWLPAHPRDIDELASLGRLRGAIERGESSDGKV